LVNRQIGELFYWLIGGLENWGINYFFDKNDNLC